ncbi:MAG: molybdopterin-dependent oxidoreductase [Caldimicrobium sp.]|nr:molybdopterin-dependent oxidoreductase [Caldimicrobium sp.]MCX7613986.1 molybdopterin-dependent oxidoreductase [Caldimicrobium sp.]MDW8182307.1 molybdopterin-dependent oxidoreductase [Caldimicrobium sp.]
MSETKVVYSLCCMCTGRCPIMVEVENGVIKHIWGNPHVFGAKSLCPRGAAGVAFEYDNERPQYPMIRDGERGSGRWKRVSWEEALDFIADKLKGVMENHGAKAIALSDRGGPHTELHKLFLRAIGSPNYFTHHATCSNSVHNAHMSIAGHARNTVGYDYKNCKYMVVFGRNLLESLITGEARNVIDMISAGGKLVYIDVRWTYTASKAYKFFMINPGTDYALVLALINVIVNNNLYDVDFVNRYVVGLDYLRAFVQPYTPSWAEKETGIPAEEIVKIAYEASEAKPSVIFNPGWMTAWHEDDFYLRRAIYTLNALMGSYEAKGGIVIAKGAGDAGFKIKQPTSLAPKVTEERCDGAGSKYPWIRAQWGLLQKLPEVIESGEPYPVKAYIAMRHDPIASMPDPEVWIKAFDQLDLLVSIDVNWSWTSWYADVILPESTYLERTDNVIVRKGLKPQLALRQKVIEPRFDSRSRFQIFKALAERLGKGEYFPWKDEIEMVNWQLEGTGFTFENFSKKGVIDLSKDPIWYDRSNLKFDTPTGKIEVYSEFLEKAGIPSLKPYESPKAPPENTLRLITGKKALHTQGRTTSNNPILNELTPENHLYIHPSFAKRIGVKDDDLVEVSSNGVSERIKVRISPFVHPQVAYMLHGFGDPVPLRTRSFGKGASDVKLMKGKLKVGVGGNCPLFETFVSIKKI